MVEQLFIPFSSSNPGAWIRAFISISTLKNIYSIEDGGKQGKIHFPECQATGMLMNAPVKYSGGGGEYDIIKRQA